MRDISIADPLKRLLADTQPKAGSLAVTIFGDCISQHGGNVWLGSLVLTMERFGLNSRQIRTAVFRLAQNGWLESERVGRRSSYGLSALGTQDYGRATGQIYRADFKAWNGLWTILVCNKDSFVKYSDFRKRLHWLGFGDLAGGTFVHPNLDKNAFGKLMMEYDAVDQTVVWRGRLESGPEESQVLLKAWDFDSVQARYEEFIHRFSTLSNNMSDQEWLIPMNAFLVRILLIHEYRRILLKVADLPEEILPPNWPGLRAMSLAKQIYSRVNDGSQIFVKSNLESRTGFFSRPIDEFYLRFT